MVELQRRGTLGRPPDADTGPDQWLRRRPGAEADRWTRARDRHCVAPCCPQPAHRTEIDHTRQHAHGGPTLTGNLGAWCTHHHRAKHHAGWRARQPLPGWFVIHTRAGILHTTRPPRILRPLPGPRPAPSPRPLPVDGPDPDHTDLDESLDPDWRERFAAQFAAKFPGHRTPPPTPPATPLDPDTPPPF